VEPIPTPFIQAIHQKTTIRVSRTPIRMSFGIIRRPPYGKINRCANANRFAGLKLLS
jgi:hypothetical protein